MSDHCLMREIRQTPYLSKLFDTLTDRERRFVLEIAEGDAAKLRKAIEFAAEVEVD